MPLFVFLVLFYLELVEIKKQKMTQSRLVITVFGSVRSPRRQDVVCQSVWDIIQKNVLEIKQASTQVRTQASQHASMPARC